MPFVFRLLLEFISFLFFGTRVWLHLTDVPASPLRALNGLRSDEGHVEANIVVCGVEAGEAVTEMVGTSRPSETVV